jgi:hypothetical protein
MTTACGRQTRRPMPTARGEEAPDERTSNLRRLDKVEKLWMQMPSVRV